MIYNKKIVNSVKSLARIVSPSNGRSKRLYEKFTIALRNFYTGKPCNAKRSRPKDFYLKSKKDVKKKQLINQNCEKKIFLKKYSKEQQQNLTTDSLDNQILTFNSKDSIAEFSKALPLYQTLAIRKNFNSSKAIDSSKPVEFMERTDCFLPKNKISKTKSGFKINPIGKKQSLEFNGKNELEVNNNTNKSQESACSASIKNKRARLFHSFSFYATQKLSNSQISFSRSYSLSSLNQTKSSAIEHKNRTNFSTVSFYRRKCYKKLIYENFKEGMKPTPNSLELSRKLENYENSRKTIDKLNYEIKTKQNKDKNTKHIKNNQKCKSLNPFFTTHPPTKTKLETIDSSQTLNENNYSGSSNLKTFSDSYNSNNSRLSFMAKPFKKNRFPKADQLQEPTPAVNTPKYTAQQSTDKKTQNREKYPMEKLATKKNIQQNSITSKKSMSNIRKRLKRFSANKSKGTLGNLKNCKKNWTKPKQLKKIRKKYSKKSADSNLKKHDNYSSKSALIMDKLMNGINFTILANTKTLSTNKSKLDSFSFQNDSNCKTSKTDNYTISVKENCSSSRKSYKKQGLEFYTLYNNILFKLQGTNCSNQNVPNNSFFLTVPLVFKPSQNIYDFVRIIGSPTKRKYRNEKEVTNNFKENDNQLQTPIKKSTNCESKLKTESSTVEASPVQSNQQPQSLTLKASKSADGGPAETKGIDPKCCSAKTNDDDNETASSKKQKKVKQDPPTNLNQKPKKAIVKRKIKRPAKKSAKFGRNSHPDNKSKNKTIIEKQPKEQQQCHKMESKINSWTYPVLSFKNLKNKYCLVSETHLQFVPPQTVPTITHAFQNTTNEQLNENIVKGCEKEFIIQGTADLELVPNTNDLESSTLRAMKIKELSDENGPNHDINNCYFIFKNPRYKSKTFKKSEWLALCKEPICKNKSKKQAKQQTCCSKSEAITEDVHRSTENVESTSAQNSSLANSDIFGKNACNNTETHPLVVDNFGKGDGIAPNQIQNFDEHLNCSRTTESKSSNKLYHQKITIQKSNGKLINSTAYNIDESENKKSAELLSVDSHAKRNSDIFLNKIEEQEKKIIETLSSTLYLPPNKNKKIIKTSNNSQESATKNFEVKTQPGNSKNSMKKEVLNYPTDSSFFENKEDQIEFQNKEEEAFNSCTKSKNCSSGLLESTSSTNLSNYDSKIINSSNSHVQYEQSAAKSTKPFLLSKSNVISWTPKSETKEYLKTVKKKQPFPFHGSAKERLENKTEYYKHKMHWKRSQNKPRLIQKCNAKNPIANYSMENSVDENENMFTKATNNKEQYSKLLYSAISSNQDSLHDAGNRHIFPTELSDDNLIYEFKNTKAENIINSAATELTKINLDEHESSENAFKRETMRPFDNVEPSELQSIKQSVLQNSFYQPKESTNTLFTSEEKYIIEPDEENTNLYKNFVDEVNFDQLHNKNSSSLSTPRNSNSKTEKSNSTQFSVAMAKCSQCTSENNMKIDENASFCFNQHKNNDRFENYEEGIFPDFSNKQQSNDMDLDLDFDFDFDYFKSCKQKDEEKDKTCSYRWSKLGNFSRKEIPYKLQSYSNELPDLCSSLSNPLTENVVTNEQQKNGLFKPYTALTREIKFNFSFGSLKEMRNEKELEISPISKQIVVKEQTTNKNINKIAKQSSCVKNKLIITNNLTSRRLIFEEFNLDSLKWHSLQCNNIFKDLVRYYSEQVSLSNLDKLIVCSPFPVPEEHILEKYFIKLSPEIGFRDMQILLLYLHHIVQSKPGFLKMFLSENFSTKEANRILSTLKNVMCSTKRIQSFSECDEDYQLDCNDLPLTKTKNKNNHKALQLPSYANTVGVDFSEDLLKTCKQENNILVDATVLQADIDNHIENVHENYHDVVFSEQEDDDHDLDYFADCCSESSENISNFFSFEIQSSSNLAFDLGDDMIYATCCESD